MAASVKRATTFPLFSAFIFAANALALTPSTTAAQAAKTYPDSQAGIEQQFSDLLQVARTGDEASIHHALDTLGIPGANAWIAAHLRPEQVAQQQQAYQQALEKFQSHIWWVTGNFGKYPDFTLKVQDSQNAPPLSDVGFESLVPRPRDTVEIRTFRFDSTVQDPNLGKPSWVSSFLYLDGGFRMIGGTYPFWAEGLNATRGPMSLPPEHMHGRTVQASAFRNDAKGPGIDAIVHIEIEVDRNGKLKKLKVLSGDPEFIPDAQQYLKDGDYPKLPNDPGLPKGKHIWDMEVVFFTPKNSPGGG